MPDAQLTDQDIENAAIRDALAVRLEAEYRQATAWADRIMGPGWEPVGRHYLVDKYEEQRARRKAAPNTIPIACPKMLPGALHQAAWRT